MIKPIAKKIFTSLLIMFSINCSVQGIEEPSNKTLLFSLESWNAKVNPQNLTIIASNMQNNDEYVLAEGAKNQFTDPTIIEKNSKTATLHYPSQHLTVKINILKNRLHFLFKSTIEQKITWPIMGSDIKTKAIIYPQGEGLYVPVENNFWQKQLNNTSLDTQGGGLSAPFWGYDLGNATLSYIAHTDLLNEFNFFVKDNKLQNSLTHDFRKVDDLEDFEISLSITEADLLAPAKHYKNYLIEKNEYKTLSEKIKVNPEVKKLIGATHAYLWGDGRDIKALEQLKALNITNMWLGYEAKPPHYTENKDKWLKKQYYVEEPFINKAKEMGYLIGPYDSFHTMQHPNKADCANTIFDNLYPTACIVTKKGIPDIGFGNRGCHASSEAFLLQNPTNKTIYNRIDSFLKTGINTYFLDCDATGELFDDYSKDHPMNQKKDRENRLKRMQYISIDKKNVLGSETAAAWSIPLLAFAHGNFSVHNAIHWPFVKNKSYGSWYPPERQGIFFKSIVAPEDYCQAKYDPRYRLPLLQAVFHEAIVMTDRWEIPHMKLSNLVKRRELLELFYGVPSIWSLDLKDIKAHGQHLKVLATFFNRLHQEIAHEPLINFKWLNDDHLVQQIHFGNTVVLTANFSKNIYQSIPPESLQVEWLKNKTTEIYQVPISSGT